MVSYLCKCIGVSKSGYYNYFNNDKIREIKEKNDERDFRLILKAYKFKKHFNLIYLILCFFAVNNYGTYQKILYKKYKI